MLYTKKYKDFFYDFRKTKKKNSGQVWTFVVRGELSMGNHFLAENWMKQVKLVKLNEKQCNIFALIVLILLSLESRKTIDSGGRWKRITFIYFGGTKGENT